MRCRSCTGPGSTRSDALRRVRRARPARCPRWATAGSTPASCRSRRWAGQHERVEHGYATAPAWADRGRPASTSTGSSGSRPTGSREMREQIRLWFYSMLFMSVALEGTRALPAGAGLREGERRDRPADAQVLGQRDLVRRRGRDDGRRRDALDVSPARTPAQNLSFGYGPAERGQAPAADAVEHLQLLRHVRQLDGFTPRWRRRARPRPGEAALARPLAAGAHAGAGPRSAAPRWRVRLAAARARRRGVRRRPVELVRAARSRSRFWKSEDDGDKRAAYWTL